MLDKESIDIYRNIRLNRDLRCEILQRHEKRHALPFMQILRPTAVLASVALIAGIILLRPSPSPTGLTVRGEEIGRKTEILTTESIDYAGGLMRLAADPTETPPLQTAEECVALEISARQDVFITVSGGMLLLPDQSGIPTFAGQSGPAPDGAAVYISLAGCDISAPITLTLSDTEGNIIRTFAITYHTGESNWRISAAKSEN